MINNAEIMTKAIQLRKELGEDSSSPIDIFAIVRSLENVSLVFYPMGEKLSGICVKGDKGNCVIGINSEMSRGRQNFSLAHELYHIYYDETLVSLCGKVIGTGKTIEKQADTFASYFLIPNDELIRKTDFYKEKNLDKKLNIDDIIRIEQYFSVSHKAMVIRLLENKIISQDDANYYLQQSVRSRAESLGLNGDLYKPLPDSKQYGTYGAYIEQADQLRQKNMISQGKYESLLLDAFRPDLVYGDDEGDDIVD